MNTEKHRWVSRILRGDVLVGAIPCGRPYKMHTGHTKSQRAFFSNHQDMKAQRFGDEKSFLKPLFCFLGDFVGSFLKGYFGSCNIPSFFGICDLTTNRCSGMIYTP